MAIQFCGACVFFVVVVNAIVVLVVRHHNTEILKFITKLINAVLL